MNLGGKELWVTHDSGTPITLGGKSVFEQLEGKESEVEVTMEGVGGVLFKITKAKEVWGKTVGFKERIMVFKCPLKEGKILILDSDAGKLGIKVVGVPNSFPIDGESDKVEDEEWTNSEQLTEETKVKLQ